jgi:hypothetical protein
MLQDFSFKIVHRSGLRHMNADALSRNPVGSAVDDEDFGEEIQDITGAQADVPENGAELLCAMTGKETEWMGVKRRALSASWEGPYQFIGHTDGIGNLDFEEGCRLCIIQDGEGHQWERSRRDLQIFYIPPD